MSAETDRVSPAGVVLWRRQVAAMLGLELRKTFLRARALPVIAIAFLPALILLLRAMSRRFGGEVAGQSAAQVATIYAQIFQLFFLRLVVFFGCFAIFTYLVRGEIAERSLHFYLLAPMRRSVFLAGKYLAGVLAAGALFTLSLAAQLWLAIVPEITAGGGAYLFGGPGTHQAFAYLTVVWLAVLGYGAVFLTLALVARNPMIPAAAILGWEWLNFLLPPVLKRISVIHYLQSLCPVPVSGGPFALPGEPTPAPLAAGGLLLLVAVLLTLAARRARRLEVLYTGD
jgi:hypothetical protein